MRLPAVDPDKEPLGRLRIETADRRVAVNRIEPIGLNIPEEALSLVFVGIVTEGEEIFSLDFSLQEQGGPARRRQLVFAIPTARDMRKLFLKTILFTHPDDTIAIEVVEVDDPFHDTDGNDRAKIGMERQPGFGLGQPARDDQVRLPRRLRPEQFVLGTPPVEHHLNARFQRIEVFHLPLSEVRFEGDRCARRHQKALFIFQANPDERGHLPVRNRILRQVELDFRDSTRCNHHLFGRSPHISEGIDLHHLQNVLSRRQIDADVFQDLEMFIGHAAPLSDPSTWNFLPVDDQLQARVAVAFDTNRYLGRQ